MTSAAAFKALQLGLAEAIDMLEYYMECEEKDVGRRDAQVSNNVELLRQLLMNSSHIQDLSENHPLLQQLRYN